jgi:hypothetical protein
MRGINRMVVQPDLGKKTQDPIRKIAKAKRAGSGTQVVEHLPKKCKGLNSNPRTKTNKQKQLAALIRY